MITAADIQARACILQTKDGRRWRVIAPRQLPANARGCYVESVDPPAPVFGDGPTLRDGRWLYFSDASLIEN